MTCTIIAITMTTAIASARFQRAVKSSEVGMAATCVVLADPVPGAVLWTPRSEAILASIAGGTNALSICTFAMS